ncbi:hypothetical protein [Geminisphaera colitermitum]|uniref:hypothetical protein n=1 Tax=Geminisphaera colitermitum TaxID=1148786 RepID=UPI000158D035|nr:hypothetical protein [Geminisphaera colitermitum]
MKTHEPRRSRPLWFLAAAMLPLLLTATPVPEVFTQTFEDASSDDTWQNVSQRGKPGIRILDDGKPALRINNHVIGHALPKTLKKSFSIEVETLHSEAGALLWFGLFDSTLGKGYIVRWSLPPANNAAGSFSIRMVNNVAAGEKPEILLRNQDRTPQSKVLGADRVPSPRPALQTPPARLKLTWEKATGQLMLECDGQVLAKTEDSELDSFENVLLSGNRFSIYRSVRITGE